MPPDAGTIAYFTMEIGLRDEMPTYSGGLGILAGDTIRSAADLGVPLVGVTLLHRKGYFSQSISPEGIQSEEAVGWIVEEFLEEMEPRVQVELGGERVQVRAWRYVYTGVSGFSVSVYFLDTDLPENSAHNRALTDQLYGGDQEYRLRQEIVLGIGGVRMLRALGYDALDRFHMNEGHSSLLVLELLNESMREAGRKNVTEEDIEKVRQLCVFTTHTPVPAGHDQFRIEGAAQVLNYHPALEIKDLCCRDDKLNMTYLGLNFSRYINGVAKKHGEVSRTMFPEHEIDTITNGVHVGTWISPPLQALFDKYILGWREDNFHLRHALSISSNEIWEAHMEAKRQLIDYANRETAVAFDPDVLTLGFGRRITAYKRPALIFWDIERLKQISEQVGKIQIVYAGKAHPQDERGKELIRYVHEAAEFLAGSVNIVFLKNYNMQIGRLITAGVDVWLNSPKPPLEASGTSGMKAALNGVPSLSVLDGWWIEGCIEGVTGWAIGPEKRELTDTGQRAADAASFYHKLESIVIPMFYKDRDRFAHIMRQAIALNGSFFNTQRMVQEYVLQAYFSPRVSTLNHSIRKERLLPNLTNS